jgi:hypothetical protein
MILFHLFSLSHHPHFSWENRAESDQRPVDTPTSEDMYFHHTEAIAGIRDARFQTMMPDALFLGKNIRAGPFVPEIVPETLWL